MSDFPPTLRHTSSQDSYQEEPASAPGLRWTPRLAILSTVTISACIAASIAIIMISDTKIVASWKVSPAVLLAILSSIMNLAFSTALTGGVAITWWLCISRHQGTNVSQLHYIWDRGEGIGFIPAVRARFDARRVALIAAFVATVQFVHNPLLQRATHQKTHAHITKLPMQLDIAQRLPDGWTGYIGNGSAITMIGSRLGLSDVQQWWRNDTILTRKEDGYNCNGTCEGTVKGAGICYHCSSTTEYLDLSTTETDGSIVFAINSTMAQNATGVPFLRLTTLYSSDVNDSCIATLTVDTCDIGAAVVEYPITIQNSTVLLNRGELQNMTVVSTYISAGDLPTAPRNAGAGPLAGLNNFFGYYLYANVTEMYDPDLNKSTYSGPSMIADLFFQPESSSYSAYTFSKCGLKWSSPTEYVLNSMHDFMFRAALRAGNSIEAQTFTARRTSQALVFHSDHRYLVAALVPILLALLSVLSLLWGWWRLGRPVNLSPLETARVLGAPILQTTRPDATVEEMLQDGEIGQRRVRLERGLVVDITHSRGISDKKVTECGQGAQEETSRAGKTRCDVAAVKVKDGEE